MRWVVIGRGGQLGRCLEQQLRGDPRQQLVAALDRAELDVGDAAAVEAFFEGMAPEPPDVLVNAAAFTGVDLCESEEALAMAINGEAPGRLAQHCSRIGTKLVHVSTDYVFDGEASVPYPTSAPLAPASAYGRSKAEGERRVAAAQPEALVVRTSWVFGPGKNFVGAILRQAGLRRRGEVSGPLRVVADQAGTPTYAADLASGLLSLATLAAEDGRARELGGLYHLTNAGQTTWWGFARAILDASGCADLEIERLATADLDLPAPRPLYSVLDCDRAAALGVRLRSWRDALVAYLESPSGLALLEAV
jgi:dTDP-4-dehydrorhamnose reductase